MYVATIYMTTDLFKRIARGQVTLRRGQWLRYPNSSTKTRFVGRGKDGRVFVSHSPKAVGRWFKEECTKFDRRYKR